MDKDQIELIEQLYSVKISDLYRFVEVMETLPEVRKRAFIKALGYENAPHMIDERIEELHKLLLIASNLKRTIPDPEEEDGDQYI